MMARQSPNRWLKAVVVGLAGWVLPGLGHLLLKETRRALIIFTAVGATFFIGIFIGSIGVVDPAGAWWWYLAQILNSPFVALLGHITAGGRYPVYGRSCELGQIYTSISGLLNLLCVVNAVYLSHQRSARPEAEYVG